LLLAAALALAGCTSTGSLSGSRPFPATAPPAPPKPQEIPVQPAPAPETPVAVPVPPPAYEPSNDRIALVLPLQSPVYGRAAEAVRAGFLAGADAAGAGARVQVIGYGDDAVLSAIATATEARVALVVGPLTRDDLKTVLALAPQRPRMLALNQLEDGAPLPPDAYALALAVEGDAAVLARRAYDDGVRSIAVVASDAPLQRRFASAFIAAWQRAGGSTPRQYRFDSNPDVLALMRHELAARPTDAILLAVGSDQAALAKSFLPPGPVYASSQITDGLPPQMLFDLDGVRYVEIPWLADPSNPAFARLPRQEGGDAVLDRLYALGLDAFLISELLANPVPPQRVEFDGATGHLSLLPSHSFSREGRVMIVHDGQPMLYQPPQ
jgi:outer membrane PBP1 activator LpoA protein